MLLSQPTNIHEDDKPTVAQMAQNAHERYSQIMRDVEGLIADHLAHTKRGTESRSKLKLLVPTVGTFFTALPMKDAFEWYVMNERWQNSPGGSDKREVVERRFVLCILPQH